MRWRCIEKMKEYEVKGFLLSFLLQGRVPYKVLQIHSTFDDYMEVTQVTFQPADPRFYFVPQNSNTVLLQPHEHSIVSFLITG